MVNRYFSGVRAKDRFAIYQHFGKRKTNAEARSTYEPFGQRHRLVEMLCEQYNSYMRYTELHIKSWFFNLKIEKSLSSTACRTSRPTGQSDREALERPNVPYRYGARGRVDPPVRVLTQALMGQTRSRTTCAR